jgi:hypothetical protein
VGNYPLVGRFIASEFISTCEGTETPPIAFWAKCIWLAAD